MDQLTYVGTRAKFRHVKKFTCIETFRQVFIFLRPPHLLDPITPSPLNTAYVYIVYLIKQGRWGRVEPREKVRRETVHKAWSKIPT
jgi:hypothetical protein